MRSHNLIGQLRNKAEKNVSGLRTYEAPTEVRVYDSQGNLKRIDPPMSEHLILDTMINNATGYYKGNRKVE